MIEDPTFKGYNLPPGLSPRSSPSTLPSPSSQASSDLGEEMPSAEAILNMIDPQRLDMPENRELKRNLLKAARQLQNNQRYKKKKLESSLRIDLLLNKRLNLK